MCSILVAVGMAAIVTVAKRAPAKLHILHPSFSIIIDTRIPDVDTVPKYTETMRAPEEMLDLQRAQPDKRNRENREWKTIGQA